MSRVQTLAIGLVENPVSLAVASLAALGLLLALTGLFLLWQRARSARTLRLIAGTERWIERAEDSAATTGAPRSRLAALTGPLVTLAELTPYAGWLRRRVARVGPGGVGPWLAAQCALAAVLGLVSATVAAPGDTAGSAVRTLTFAALGAYLPLVLLAALARRRLAAFERQLPQAIDTLAGALEAGASLGGAVDVIARDLTAPISEEFARTVREVRFGLPLYESLLHMQARVPGPDLALLAGAVALQQEVGGNLAGVLRRLGHTVRERLRIRGEIRVLTSQGRYSAYIVTALPVILFVIMWLTNYPYLSGLFLPGLPRLLLAGAAAGIVVGYVSMQRIIAFDQ